MPIDPVICPICREEFYGVLMQAGPEQWVCSYSCLAMAQNAAARQEIPAAPPAPGRPWNSFDEGTYQFQVHAPHVLSDTEVDTFGPGKKFDNGKTRWDLVPSGAVDEVAKILTFGAEKYGANNWQNVAPFESRYFAALQRHLAAWRQGEKTDAESGRPHLAHAACCLLFLLSKEVGFDPNLEGR